MFPSFLFYFRYLFAQNEIAYSKFGYLNEPMLLVLLRIFKNANIIIDKFILIRISVAVCLHLLLMMEFYMVN